MAESILHFNGVTIRVNGTGNLDMTFIGLDEVNTFECTPLAMSLTPGREPTKLANFNSQRARLRMSTDEIDEYMKVNRVVIWIKPVATQFPSLPAA